MFIVAIETIIRMQMHAVSYKNILEIVAFEGF